MEYVHNPRPKHSCAAWLHAHNLPTLQLRYRNRIPYADLPKLGAAAEMYQIILGAWDLDTLQLREEFKACFFDRRNRLIGFCPLTVGGPSSTTIPRDLVLALALLLNARSILVTHNHPGGSLHPSAADKFVTQQLRDACSSLGLRFVDHLIVTQNGYWSHQEQTDGQGNPGAVTPVPVVEPAYRPSLSLPDFRIKKPENLHNYLRSVWDQADLCTKQAYGVCLLATSGRLIGYCPLPEVQGTPDALPLSFVIKLALIANAGKIMVARNSIGKPKMTEADYREIKKLSAELAPFDLRLLDYLIFSPDEYFSFGEAGIN
jgi:DNA repair protein RadC